MVEDENAARNHEDHPRQLQFITLRWVGLEKATIKFGKKIAPVVLAGPLKAIVVAPKLAGTVNVTASDAKLASQYLIFTTRFKPSGATPMIHSRRPSSENHATFE